VAGVTPEGAGYRRLAMDASHAHFIDNRAHVSPGADTITVVDPSTGEVVGAIPAGTPDDATAAVVAAARAARDWARLDPASRAGRVKAGARRLRERIDEIALLQSREGGKPLPDSRGGVEAGIGALEQYAELGPLHRGRSLQGGWDATDLMVHEPLGVAVALTPWNDPVAIAGGLIGAALVTGNTLVLKPSERTPLSSLLMATVLAEELPAGVLNVALGDRRIAAPLVADDRVDVVVHVGSVATGREIASACAGQLKKAVLELGGKDAVVVDEGVDPRWAAEQAATGAFANSGQICTSVERIYVHDAVAEPFLDELVRIAKARRVGPATEDGVEMGPLIDDRQRAVVHSHVTEAVAAGATVLAGGEVPGGPGSFYPPTVLTSVTDEMAVMREETFGPVAAVAVVPSFEAGLEAAGRSAYGLAATVLTPSAAHATRAWRELRVGTVKVNGVFGGAPGGSAHPGRGSGLGFGYGPELLDELTHTKVVHLEPAPKRAAGAGDGGA
jgi:acyl-CoA reductase-like NAD-dependent aldehyde dehydrogenase